jgi:hypothetical protein
MMRTRLQTEVQLNYNLRKLFKEYKEKTFANIAETNESHEEGVAEASMFVKEAWKIYHAEKSDDNKALVRKAMIREINVENEHIAACSTVITNMQTELGETISDLYPQDLYEGDVSMTVNSDVRDPVNLEVTHTLSPVDEVDEVYDDFCGLVQRGLLNAFIYIPEVGYWHVGDEDGGLVAIEEEGFIDAIVSDCEYYGVRASKPMIDEIYKRVKDYVYMEFEA